MAGLAFGPLPPLLSATGNLRCKNTCSKLNQSDSTKKALKVIQ